MPTVCKNGNCGNASCGFGKKRLSAFGAGANSFFIPQYTGPANIQNVGACLQNGVYYTNNAAPLMRYGNKKNSKSGGPMKIGKKK